MMIKILKPSPMYFLIVMIISTLMLMSSSSWLLMWLCLEANSLSFLPIMLNEKTTYESESALMYYLVQGMGSSLMMMGVLNMKSMHMHLPPMFMLGGVVMKLGMVPMHMWMPTIMSSMSWSAIMLLTTWQKLPGMLLLSKPIVYMNSLLTIVLMMMNVITGSINGMKQTHLRPLLAYSSMVHMGWMLMANMSSPMLMIIYITTYAIIMVSIVKCSSSMELMKSFNHNSSHSWMELNSVPLLLNLLSMGGMPPLLGFIPKLMVVCASTSINHTSTMIMVSLACMSLYYYLMILVGGTSTPNKMKMVGMNLKSSMWVMTCVFITLMIT